MSILKKKHLTKWIVFLPVFAVFLTFFLILSIIISAENIEYKNAIDLARKSYIKDSKAQAKERIDKLTEYIALNEIFVLNEAQEEIKTIVNLGYQIIHDIYTENAHLPREKILEKIRLRLKQMRFFNDLSGYFVIFDLSGTCEMHGEDSSLEGKNFIDLTDANGHYFMKEGLARLQREEAFPLVYPWKNPKETHARNKLGYVKRYLPLNIYVASGRYEDEVRERIKKETQKLLNNTRYGEHGYIFAYDYKGNTIAHGDTSLIGKNRWDVQSDNEFIMRDFIKGAQKNLEGFFISYTATYHPDNMDNREKVSFVKAIPQFEWIVGTGAYLEEENAALREQEESLHVKMKNTIQKTVFVSLLIMAFVMGVMLFVSRRIEAMISRYENHLVYTNRHIKEQKRIFEMLYQKSADGVWLLKDGVFIDCNEAIVRMFKAKNKHELINIAPMDISPEFQPDGESSHQKSLRMNQTALENGVHKFEWQARTFEGTLFWISVVMTTIRMDKSIIQHASVRDITIRKGLEEENKKQKKLLMHQVEHDILTGLPNRNLLQDRLTQAIKKASRDAKILGVVFVDVDKFKSVNDSLGHDAGDMLLKLIANVMCNSIRSTDTVARLSGDEFIILLDGCSDISDILIAIRKLVLAFQTPLHLGNESFKVTMSMGVSIYPHDGESASSLLKNADIAMYKAKMEGRNRYKFFDQEMNQETNEHLEIERSLYKALANNELELYYQPQINLQTEAIVGVEALIRWNHPIRGFTTPGYFIHVAEESELIVEIGNWVLREGLKQLKAWYDSGLNPGKIAINFASKQLDSPLLVNHVIHALKESGAKASWLEMEIVERFIMKDSVRSIALLRRMRELDIDISIDDFGTGHSSLSYLKQLPITKLKIDQSFVQKLEQSKEDRAIARTIIELGRGLGLKVLAEGVESEAQKEFIYASGCELMQGYLFSKPLPASEFETLLKTQNHML